MLGEVARWKWKSGSPFAGSFDQGEPNVLYRLSGEFKFKPNVVKSMPKARDANSASFILITPSNPNKPYGSGGDVPPPESFESDPEMNVQLKASAAS